MKKCKAITSLCCAIAFSGKAAAGIIPFDIYQVFSQGNTLDLAETVVSLGEAGAFTVDPGSSGDYFDFSFAGAGTFSTTSDEINSYHFLNSYAKGEVIAAGNFGSQVSAVDDWDSILVSGQTKGVWGSDHSGYLGFVTDKSLFGWIAYDFTRTDSISTLSLLNGAYSDSTHTGIHAGAGASVSVSEPLTTGLFCLGVAGMGLLRKRTLG